MNKNRYCPNDEEDQVTRTSLVESETEAECADADSAINRDQATPFTSDVQAFSKQYPVRWNQKNGNPDRSRMSRALPDATYRLQFHSGFTFRQASEIVPYLAALGITHVYASPFLKSVAGSRHGYDIVDQSTLNPEIGTEQDYEDFVRTLHDHGLGQIMDVVPNHMGVFSNDNTWWNDVLENGPSSPYAKFFDIQWMPLKPDLASKVLIPVLGDQFGQVLEKGQLTLRFEDGAFFVQYFDRRFPIEVGSSALILNHRRDQFEQLFSASTTDNTSDDQSSDQGSAVDDESRNPELMEYRSILTAIKNLPSRTEIDQERTCERRREQEVIKRRLRELYDGSPTMKAFLDENVRRFNGTPGDSASFDLLDQLLFEQSYRLAYWRVAADEINYRRFFDVNDLAAICMERPEVFDKSHSLALRLIKQGQIDGLRIDHSDGLYDPSAYLQQLRDVVRESSGEGNGSPSKKTSDSESNSSASPAELEAAVDEVSAHHIYLVVEKILGRGELLPLEWPIDGTTGYDFLNQANGLFVDKNNVRAFDRLYSRFIRESLSFRDLVYQCKKQIMDVAMSSEITMLGHQLDEIAAQNRMSRDFTLNSLTNTLREIIACFPVYRTYINAAGVNERDGQYIEHAAARAKRRNPAISTTTFDFVRDVLLLRVPPHSAGSVRDDWLRFVGRFQQVTGPVMAKGVEDTAFYIYNRLVSLNEVGGDPDKFGLTVSAFHQLNLERHAHWPHAMLASSTHDTKRTEDVRARLNVLSEIPTEWQRRLTRWSRVNSRKKQDVDGQPAPSRNDEYLLYQALIGTWPHGEMCSADRNAYQERIEQYMLKSAHEAKVHTSWISPHEPYEESLRVFIAALLNDSRKNAFLVDFVPFAQRVARCGLWNSLAQTLLKLSSPGVPDFYQGCEIWDFCLVDPDNRRPVDFEERKCMLNELQRHLSEPPANRAQFIRELMEHPTDGRLKMFVIALVLNERRHQQGLFTTGDYIPLEVTGPRQEHVCAYARVANSDPVIVVVPRLIAQMTDFSGESPTNRGLWEDTRVQLPASLADTEFRHLFTNADISVISENGRSELMLADIFESFPVALLERVDRVNH